MLVIAVKLIRPPSTARKIQRNMTATRSPIWRRSASQFSSSARARSSCFDPHELSALIGSSRGPLGRWSPESAGLVLTGFFSYPLPDVVSEATIHTREVSRLIARNRTSLRYGSQQGESRVHVSGYTPPTNGVQPNARSEASARAIAGGVRHLLHRAAAADDGTPRSLARVLLLREPPGRGARGGQARRLVQHSRPCQQLPRRQRRHGRGQLRPQRGGRHRQLHRQRWVSVTD